MYTEIGKVEEVYLGFEDHGLFCYLISLDFGGSGQGYGAFSIGSNSRALRESPTWTDEVLSRGMRKLIELHEFFKVDTLKKTVGMYVEVERDEPYGAITRIKRLPVDGGAVFDAQK